MGAWISSLLDSWGRMESRIALLGLDAAGKTSILYKLKLGENVTTIPTIGFNVETVSYKKLDFTMWDVGGQKKLRKLWRHYLQNTDALIFVVDSADRERLALACEEMHAVLDHPDMDKAAVLVLANKQDMPGAASAAEVAEAMKLRELRGREWWAQACCATNGDGLYDGLDWLHRTLQRRPARA